MALHKGEEREQVVHRAALAGRGGRGGRGRRCSRSRCGSRNRRRATTGRRGGAWRRGLRHRHRLAGLGATDAHGAGIRQRRFGLAIATAAALGFCGDLPAERAAHGQARHEYPADVRNRLTADETTLLEEPLILTVELLKAVVGEDDRIHLVGDAQHERIAAADGPRWRRNEFVVGDRLVELVGLLRIDAVPEGGIDHDGDERIRLLLHEGHDGLIELFQAGLRTTFSGNVRTIDDNMMWHNASSLRCPGVHCSSLAPAAVHRCPLGLRRRDPQ